MNVSRQGIDFIKQFEAFRSEPYLDAAGIATIGYGATYYPDGQRVRMSDAPVSESQASQMLEVMVERYAAGIDECVRVPLAQAQLDALASWAYNVGLAAALGSTLLRLLNAGSYSAAADQLLRWNKAGGRERPGLTRRRQAERAMFLSGIAEVAP